LNSLKSRWIPIAGILLLAATTTLAVAQVGEPGASESAFAEDEIPADALKTEEGRQLADRLRFLRRSQSSMGPKHPAYGGVQAEIDSIRERLGISDASVPSLDGMGDPELRQLIRRMALRIDSLEKRVDALERRLEVF